MLRQAGRNDGNTVSWLNLGETKNLKAWKVLRGVRDRQTIMMGTRLSSSALAKGGGRGGGRPRGRGRGRDHTSGRTASSQLVNDLEVEIANAVGIHPFMFSVEEAIRIPPGVEASAYAKVSCLGGTKLMNLLPSWL